MAAGVLIPYCQLRSHPPAAVFRGNGRRGVAVATSALSSPSDDASPGDAGDSSPRRRRRRPTVAEIRRAIGAEDRHGVDGESPNSSPSSSPIMDFLASTPIGQPESPAERTLREFAERIVEHAEANVHHGQNVLIMLCLYALPVWTLLLLVASGVIKLPFSLPFMEDLIM
ncbi:hypothetical protein AXF42_Ash017191 [Apostasia shenzhenica]|uniref:Uncharacterized protein n=1 Tax=Apostasia shenzhenica TaxID=1088818 RepID=A0A2H9ZVF6_9ASPA|nr:hypothetical protein AXF42_Ash017191 [Apostasia shenzhenica]